MTTSPNRLVLALLAAASAVASCAAHTGPAMDADLAYVVASVGPETPARDDELRAYAPVRLLTESAGRGLEGNADLSASCGCADVGSASSGPGSGPGTSPDVDYGKKAFLNVEVKIER
jgi:hypothetical protein